MFCKKCGEQIENNVQFCSKCGQAVNEPIRQESTPEQPTTVDKVEGGIQGIILIVAIIMIIVTILSLLGTSSNYCDFF
jgi:uncharacterized membrane protein YvbJ